MMKKMDSATIDREKSTSTTIHFIKKYPWHFCFLILHWFQCYNYEMGIIYVRSYHFNSNVKHEKPFMRLEVSSAKSISTCNVSKHIRHTRVMHISIKSAQWNGMEWKAYRSTTIELNLRMHSKELLLFIDNISYNHKYLAKNWLSLALIREKNGLFCFVCCRIAKIAAHLQQS